MNTLPKTTSHIVSIAILCICFISSCGKQKVNSMQRTINFIDHTILDKGRDETCPTFESFSPDDETVFRDVERAMHLSSQNDMTKAWEVWIKCIDNISNTNYPELVYLAMGKSIGEIDAGTSHILLEKALRTICNKTNHNELIKYCCLNELIQLLVRQVSYDELDIDIDEQTKQYSIRAHNILTNKTSHIKENTAQNSIYRIACESLLWLGEDSLANIYIQEYNQNISNYSDHINTEAYVSMLKGIKHYIANNDTSAIANFSNAINTIGAHTSFLDVNLEQPYAYKSCALIRENKYTETIQNMEWSTMCLLNNPATQNQFHYTPYSKLVTKTNAYNVAISYIQLFKYYKIAYANNISGYSLDKLIAFSDDTKEFIEAWFLNLGDEKTLVLASELIKQTNAILIEAIFETSSAHDFDQLYQLMTEASSFYLNYLISLKDKSKKNKRINALSNSISELTIKLKNTSKEKALEDTYIKDRLSLLKYKSLMYDKNISDYFKYNTPIPHIKNEHTAILKYFINDKHIYGLLYSDQHKRIIRTSTNSFNKEKHKLLRQIKSISDDKAAQKQIYKQLVSPFEKELSDIKELMILADENMNSIPFELLVDRENKHLVEQYAISYYSSAISNQNYDVRTNSPLLAVAPGFEKNHDTSLSAVSLKPIKHSIEEIYNIEYYYKEYHKDILTLTKEEATKKNFIKHAKDKSIIHLSTHGISDKGEVNGLYFCTKEDDCFLSLPELYQMKFNANLVVLAACQTNVGKVIIGEGTLSLPRGFIYAGIPNIIASLWYVNDESTRFFMTHFYKHLLTDKYTYSEALRLTKLDCIQENLPQVDWAGFILISK